MTPASPRKSMSPELTVLFLALLLGLQPMATDLYLPALPALKLDLEASMAQTQLTLTSLLLAFGMSQLVWGPLSDRFGRRPVLLVGMGAFVVASIGSAMAHSIETLTMWRTLQGVAMGAGVMCARAIVRDLYQPAQGANVMSKGLSGLGIIACIAAPVGGVLTAVWSWHAALLALAVYGVVGLGLIAWRFEETLPVGPVRSLHPYVLAQTWFNIIRNPTFVAYSALSVCSYGGLFTFLATSSFVLIQVLGLSATQYGMAMMGMSLVYMAGTFLCRRLLVRWGLKRTVALAGIMSITGGTLMGVLSLAGVQSFWAIYLPHLIFMLGHGIHQPCGQSGAVGPFPEAAGTASALNGFLMMVVAFGTGQWLGKSMDGTVFPLTLGLWFWSVLLAITSWTLVQRYGKS